MQLMEAKKNLSGASDALVVETEVLGFLELWRFSRGPKRNSDNNLF
jgi:hypothetical protein